VRQLQTPREIDRLVERGSVEDASLRPGQPSWAGVGAVAVSVMSLRLARLSTCSNEWVLKSPQP
jgi:hypothetical protein